MLAELCRRAETRVRSEIQHRWRTLRIVRKSFQLDIKTTVLRDWTRPILSIHLQLRYKAQQLSFIVLSNSPDQSVVINFKLVEISTVTGFSLITSNKRSSRLSDDPQDGRERADLSTWKICGSAEIASGRPLSSGLELPLLQVNNGYRVNISLILRKAPSTTTLIKSCCD